MNILLTGGMGYIGSRKGVVLVDAGHHAVCYDNFSNNQQGFRHNLGQISGRSIVFVRSDVQDFELLQQILEDHAVDTVVHFTSLMVVANQLVILYLIIKKCSWFYYSFECNEKHCGP